MYPSCVFFLFSGLLLLISNIVVQTHSLMFCFHLWGLSLLAAIDAPGGFLFEWWSVFWDIFIARSSDNHSEAAASYLEVIIYACFSLSRGSERKTAALFICCLKLYY